MPKDENYMVSPYSLKMALAMLANGADGATRQEILGVLGIDDLDKSNTDMQSFIANAVEEPDNSRPGVSYEPMEFNIANSIWINTDYFGDIPFGFSDEYKALINTYFDGEAREVNNTNGAGTINGWITEKTKDKIKDVLTDDIVRESASFLVNTIYFKAGWSQPFSETATKTEDFTDRNGGKTPVDMMNSIGDELYYENNNFQMLKKPYAGNKSISMYFILPKKDASVTKSDIDAAIGSLDYQYVDFKLPKFKTEYFNKDIVNIMKELGVSTVFDKDLADLGASYTDMPINIFVSKILQKTFIAADEKGTEEAAATVIIAAAGSAQGGSPSPIPVKFYCDRPFTYFIRDDASGEILFLGEYAFAD